MSAGGGRETNRPESQAAAKDPEQWVTGGEPMTAAQQSYLSTLGREAGRDVPDEISKADASKLIDEFGGDRPGRRRAVIPRL